MIIINELTKMFKDIIAVDHINLKVEEGEVFGFLGPNGAGKTTTIRMLSCLIRPTSGTAFLNGYEILKDSMEIRKMIGVLTENPCIYERLSGRYNLEFFGKLYDVPKEVLSKRVDELLNLFDLSDRADDKSGKYSKGMKKKLAIARALLHEPKILFLDEPTSGLDPKAAKDLRDYIRKLSKERKITIFLCTHNLTEVEYLCDKIAVINKGKIVGMGSPKELSKTLWSGERTEIVLADKLDEKNISKDRIIDSITSIPGINECVVKDDIIKISSESAKKVNPQIIKNLISQNLDIIEVKILGHSLEEIYLSLIKEDVS